ncbi:hypothetical protein AWC05_18840 [Mycobacterium florentinum]|uniref:VWFA domain-containing protein n=1 Tax=Mycobacterium florentinum TaxID=292462 RepID=A0A1X1UBM9_MYCFL|nr:hypothetical protein AWC05_18840 [Mycobacterium florentinum]BBX78634.1 hypothetical protein MFLOJ_24210 [Mycobacterium florentinum]
MEPKGSILPVYFVADESGSMSHNIGDLNDSLTSLTQSVISSGQALASCSAELQFEKPEGFTLAVDIV